MENFVQWVALAMVFGIVFYFIVASKKSVQILPSQEQTQEATTDPNELMNKVLDQLAEEQASSKLQKQKLTADDVAWDFIPDDFVIFDLETTGLQKDAVADIIEIAALKFNKQKYLASQKVDAFTCLVRPWRGGLNPGAMAVNKITQEMIDHDGREMSTVLKEFVDFVGDRPLVAYNVAFDRWFLKRELSDHGIDKKFSYSCALEIARAAFPNSKNHKLATVASSLGFDTSGAHRALEDCKMAFQVYLWGLTKVQRVVEDEEMSKRIQPIEGLTGKSIVFVGELRLLPKREMETLAKLAGMIVKTTVSKNVDIVVVGKDAGEKEQKAIELKRKILNEWDFGKMILPLQDQFKTGDFARCIEGNP